MVDSTFSIRLCKKAGLNEPEFKQEDVFKTIIRRTGQAEIKATPQATPQAEFIKHIFSYSANLLHT